MRPPPYRSSLSSISRCQSSITALNAQRGFSTSQTHLKIGPESPKFIEVPQPPQRYARPKRDIKGVLPPPRNIFPRRGGDKTSSEYLAFATPEPTSPRKLAEPATDQIAWRRRLAETRRQHLREGLVQLHERKIKIDAKVATRSNIKTYNRELRYNAPPRDDEALTAPTITVASSALQKGMIPDPNRSARLQAAAANVAAKEAMLSDQRRDALHTLYMNARSFITNTQELENAIESAFTEAPFKGGTDESIWAEGAPPTVQDLLSVVSKTEKTVMGHRRKPAVLTGQRMKRIAEELTGGVMD